MKLFMIDIETTGVNFKEDDIIEIAIVEMLYKNGFYEPSDRVFHTYNYTAKQPTSKFALEHMKGTYAMANSVPHKSPEQMNSEIAEFLQSQGSKGAKNTQLCGWNLSTFDIPFMVEKGYLKPSTYDKDDNLIGDFHYRPYEMSGSVEYLSSLTGYSRKTILRMAEENPRKPEIVMPEGRAHDATFDCFKQIDTLNGLLAIGRDL